MSYKLIKQHLQDPQYIERMVAFALDLIISLVLSIIPTLGWLLGFGYFFLKDALPMTRHDSFGKHIYKLYLSDASTGERIEKGRYEKSMIRSLILLVPIINIIDIVHFLTYGNRLADEWTNTMVRKIDSEPNQASE
jgi:hypothetical protein